MTFQNTPVAVVHVVDLSANVAAIVNSVVSIRYYGIRDLQTLPTAEVLWFC